MAEQTQEQGQASIVADKALAYKIIDAIQAHFGASEDATVGQALTILATLRLLTEATAMQVMIATGMGGGSERE